MPKVVQTIIDVVVPLVISCVSNLVFQKAYRPITHEVDSINQTALHSRKPSCEKKAVAATMRR